MREAALGISNLVVFATDFFGLGEIQRYHTTRWTATVAGKQSQVLFG